MNFKAIFFCVFSALLFAGCLGGAQADDHDDAEADHHDESSLGLEEGEHLVRITKKGFQPSTLTIKQGETVVFVNQDNAKHWPATAQHPTHLDYPESTGKCFGADFDACKGLEHDERYKFTFNHKGEWPYHDHLAFGQPFFGKIIVE
ncbi:MAG: hypothetical protein ACE5DI_04715 [Candidatus Micrarchaeia archaeon]